MKRYIIAQHLWVLNSIQLLKQNVCLRALKILKRSSKGGSKFIGYEGVCSHVNQPERRDYGMISLKKLDFLLSFLSLQGGYLGEDEINTSSI